MVRDRRANWKQSLAVLRAAKAAGARITKTSIMLGCGEQPQEVLEAMQILRDAGKPPASIWLALYGRACTAWLRANRPFHQHCCSVHDCMYMASLQEPVVQQILKILAACRLGQYERAHLYL